MPRALEALFAPDIVRCSKSWTTVDNILIAYEMNHYLLNKRKVETSYAAIKLDMSKAYDRVEWSLLEQMMAKMGFHSR